MGKDNEIGICTQCKEAMNIYQERCPRCGAKREECFLSDAQANINIAQLRKKAWSNLFSDIKVFFGVK